MYTTQQQVEDHLKRSLTDQEAEIFPTMAASVKNTIDNYCARTFEDDGSTTTQVYDGGDREIFLDIPARSISAINYIDPNLGVPQLIDATSYVTFPYNSTPVTSIMMKSGYFGWGYKNVEVTGVFGDFATAPEDIQMAATIMCANTYSIQLGNLSAEAIEGYARKWDYTNVSDFPPTVQMILDSRKRVVL